MNRSFKLRFDQMKEGNPAEGEPQASALPEEEFIRPLNLCLVWPDGKRFFLSYSYLIAGEFMTGGEQNEITLFFTAYTVVLKGYELEPLFLMLSDHLLSQVVVTEARYTTSKDTGLPMVTEMRVESVDKS